MVGMLHANHQKNGSIGKSIHEAISSRDFIQSFLKAMQSLLYYSYRRFSRFNHWYERRFTGVGRIALAAAIGAAIFGVDTEQTTAYQAFTYLAALIALAVATAPLFRSRFAVRRDLPRFASAGEPLEYRVRISNLGKRAETGLTLFEDIEFAWPTRAEFQRAREPGVQRNWVDELLGFYRWTWLVAERRNASVEPAPLPVIPARGEATVTARLTPRRRGMVRLAGASIARPDPLQLFRAFFRTSAPQSLAVLPRRYPLPLLALPGSRRYQQGGVALAGSVGDSEEFVSLREYRPGDPLQRVHWKSFARVGRPVVKEYQDEYFERHVLALDTAYAPQGEAAFEAAVSIAASFVYTLDTQECLLDLLFIGGEVHCQTAGRGLLRAEHLLEVLAAVRMQEGPAIERLKHAVLARRGALTSCILVLAGWDEARRNLVEALRGSGLQVLALAVVDERNVSERIDPSQGVRKVRLGHVQQDLAAL